MQGTSENIIDPAKLVFLDVKQNKINRLQNETSEKLEEIKGRVDAIVSEYECVRRKEKLKSSDKTENTIVLGILDDSDELYHLLADPGLRSEHSQNLETFIMEYEQKCEQLERVLSQLQDFFIEMQAGDTQQLLDQVTKDEIDLEKTTAALDVALGAASLSMKKLWGIKEKMDHHLAHVTIDRDTNKRKKRRKSLLNAQGEVKMEEKLQKTTDRCTQLQVQLDEKTQECTRLSGINDELKQLQVSNKAIIKELEVAQDAFQNELEQVKSDNQNLESQMECLIENHKNEMEESKSMETQRFEEELKAKFEEMSKQLIQVRNQVNKLQERLVIMEAEKTSLIEKLQQREKDGMLLQQSLVMPQPIQDQFPLPSSLIHSESNRPLVDSKEALDDLPTPLGLPLNLSSVNNWKLFIPGSQQPVPCHLFMLAGSKLSPYSSLPQVISFVTVCNSTKWLCYFL